ncbi:MAG: hypothetical protein IT250_05450 [Chitinophagaceae bacterium]|nr:hypothetical protein [Chitinophagaceae bacterium]
MKPTFLIFAAVLFLFSCNNTDSGNTTRSNNASVPKTLSDSLYKAAMDGHDVGMAKMGELSRYRHLIEQKIDSLTAKKVKAKLLHPLDSALKALSGAEEGMHLWMQEFDPDKAGSTETEKVQFYRLEKEKIDSVNARILESIDAAKRVAE